MQIAKELVKLYRRPSRDGRSFTYYMDYTDLGGQRQRVSLGHSDTKKAGKQRKQLEKELRMGYVEPDSMRLSRFMKDCLLRSKNLVRQSTLKDYESVMRDFISAVGDRDFRCIEHTDGEYYLNCCVEKDNAPATIKKKVRTLKRLYNLALQRRQIDENPFRFLKGPKVAKKKVLILSEPEIANLLKATRTVPDLYGFRWDVLILTAWLTGMRKGELLNLTWRDIDFENRIVQITAKEDTELTWHWDIKDHDERTLPLTDELIDILTELQVTAQEGCPYVFVPYARYQEILEKRSQGNWDSVKTRENLIPHFSPHFQRLRSKAGILKDVTFHDLRSTALSGWCSNGMDINDVKNLAGHSNIVTTQEFYLAVTSDLVDRARRIKSSTTESVLAHFVTHPNNGQNETGKIECKSM
jgi:integrase/recombinase XerC